jgi:hypothetical protein
VEGKAGRPHVLEDTTPQAAAELQLLNLASPEQVKKVTTLPAVQWGSASLGQKSHEEIKRFEASQGKKIQAPPS